jgi:quinol monooxygenase YgiN
MTSDWFRRCATISPSDAVVSKSYRRKGNNDVPAKPLRVIVSIVAKPDRVEQMRQLLLSLIAPSSAEDGCRSYELLHNLQDSTDFTVIEEWQSETHYAGHLSSPHVQAALGPLAELWAKPLEIRRYERLGD